MSFGLSYEFDPDETFATAAIPKGFELVRYGASGTMILRKLVDSPPPGEINSWIYKPGPNGYLERNRLVTIWNSSPMTWQGDAFGGSAGFDSSVNPLTALATGVPQIVNDAQQQPGTSLFDLVSRALQVYQLDRQQRAFLETNRELIRQGRPPIAWDQFQPVANVGIQIDSQTKQMLWILGGGALVLLTLMAFRR